MQNTVEVTQHPAPGTHTIAYRGDVLHLVLSLSAPAPGTAFLRTTLGRAATRRGEIMARVEQDAAILGRDWHDIAMERTAEQRYEIRLPLLDIGRFEAKCCFLQEGRRDPIWPPGPNIVLKVEPAETVRGNTMYTAFVRQFGPNRERRPKQPAAHRQVIEDLEAAGYTVIPTSGTFRDLIKQLDFILGTLRFRIVQLLPIHPIPTTYARMGRFGSPFAALDFFDVDPALAEFDRRTTPLEQFDELVDEVHRRDAQLFLDIPVNHTGWASRLQIEHPEWFVRDHEQTFASPGAWGVTWEDLSELDYRGHPELWHYMARVFLFWRRRGVDGFRCDAGYKLPYEAWEYIVAKVRNEFPATIFFLEGLGGKWSTAEALLGGANLDWAYSELFQNYDRRQVEAHLSYCLHASRTHGTLLHYAETHDNNRLAATSPRFARLRTALAALCSEAGAFGLTNGAEWFADEKIDVHGAPPLRWGAADNMVDDLRRLNTLLNIHPCFHAGAAIRLIDPGPHNAVGLLRESPDGAERLLVLAHLDAARSADLSWPETDFPCTAPPRDLLSGRDVPVQRIGDRLHCTVNAEELLCLSAQAEPLSRLTAAIEGTAGIRETAERQRARAKALDIYQAFHPDQGLQEDPDELLRQLTDDPRALCARLQAQTGPTAGHAPDTPPYAPVVRWDWPRDVRRTVMVPPGHFLLVTATHPFSATIEDRNSVRCDEKSLRTAGGAHTALFLPQDPPAEFDTRRLRLRVMRPGACRHAEASLLFLPPPDRARVRRGVSAAELKANDVYAILANERGAMAQVHAAWGLLTSAYDALLAANLDPECPSDRMVLWTRCRMWLLFKGYSQAIDHTSLHAFERIGNRAVAWRFHVPTSDGQRVNLTVRLHLDREQNTVRLIVRREHGAHADGRADHDPVTIIFRPDIEDRSQHGQTKAWSGPQTAWPGAVTPRADGYDFAPSPDHSLALRIRPGHFVSEPEWTYNVKHPVETERGLEDASDLFSPGYLSAELKGGQTVVLTGAVRTGTEAPEESAPPPEPAGAAVESDALGDSLREAMQAFIVKRNRFKTVIAGYPWFLDWGRDTLICLRGMIAAGRTAEARAILREFAHYEQQGTLPNMIRGRDVSDRDTSDAPLWFLVACGDLLHAEQSLDLLREDCGGRTLREVMHSIVDGYCRGTPNGIVMDRSSGLIFSPAHFTWMDTNYPAGTPRQGYPVEIQALWIAGLNLLNSIEHHAVTDEIRCRARESLGRLYPVTHGGASYLSDCLHARTGQRASDALADDALRPNQLFAITLGCLPGRARRIAMLDACEQLLVPGAIRTLADQPVRPPLRIARDGEILGDPVRPYRGRYEGDEDTRRKPAYHNGTAWGWPFPSYCEALALTYGSAVKPTALALLSSCCHAMNSGCLGQLPEIMDGDTPHRLKGCGAQAWSVTEAYRVIATLRRKG